VEGSEKLSFEEAFQQLAGVVQQLEAGDLPLEQSLGLFEHGMRLAKHCETELDKAELRVSQIVGAEDGRGILEPFDAHD
jgi:exodeoxyribonuclease VII small subunit